MLPPLTEQVCNLSIRPIQIYAVKLTASVRPCCGPGVTGVSPVISNGVGSALCDFSPVVWTGVMSASVEVFCRSEVLCVLTVPVLYLYIYTHMLPYINNPPAGPPPPALGSPILGPHPRPFVSYRLCRAQLLRRPPWPGGRRASSREPPLACF